LTINKAKNIYNSQTSTYKYYIQLKIHSTSVTTTYHCYDLEKYQFINSSPTISISNHIVSIQL